MESQAAPRIRQNCARRSQLLEEAHTQIAKAVINLRTGLKRFIVAVILAGSVLALFGASGHVKGQGGGISVTVSWINGTPTTITYTSTTTSLVPVAPIPGFTLESIALGIVLGILAIILLRHKRA